MKLDLGNGTTLEVSEETADSLRRQLGVTNGNATELINALAAAKQLGVSREYIYEHAEELGGRKIGNGPKAPWRFDPAKLCQVAASTAGSERQAQAPKPSRRRRQGGGSGLLEIRGKKP